MLREEMETIISFDEKDDTACVYTINGRLKRRLRELLASRAEEVFLLRSDQGFEEYSIPKKWIKINPTRKGRVPSEAQLEALRKGHTKA